MVSKPPLSLSSIILNHRAPACERSFRSFSPVGNTLRRLAMCCNAECSWGWQGLHENRFFTRICKGKEKRMPYHLRCLFVSVKELETWAQNDKHVCTYWPSPRVINPSWCLSNENVLLLSSLESMEVHADPSHQLLFRVPFRPSSLHSALNHICILLTLSLTIFLLCQRRKSF